MLKVDLGLLARQHRVRIDDDIAATDPLWADLPSRFVEPVTVRLEVQQAGSDVVARGTAQGTTELACRRCLRPVRHELDLELTLFYRAGMAGADAEAEEIYVLPARAGELDLGPAVREHVLLAAPEYVVCAQDCRGFCPRCGTNLNEASCDCVVEDEDPRWAALRRLRTE